MNKSVLKKLGITIASVFLGIYLIFLLLPLLINPIIKGYVPELKNIIHESLGLDSEIYNIKVITTPKLTAGLKVEKFVLLEPNNKEIFSADNFQVKMSLLPIFVRNIEVDLVELDNAKANILFNNDGSIAIAKYLPTQENQEANLTNNQKDETTQNMGLPFGFKLSNHLPNIKINNYNFALTDGMSEYVLNGNNTQITDFILNKSIKIQANGSASLKNREQFKYNVKIFNQIMPELDLNELVFNSTPTEENNVQNKKDETVNINIIDILQGIYTNNITANANVDLNISKEEMKGNIDFSKLSILNLPESFVKLQFKGNSINVDSNIYTAKNEVSKINGLIKTGKHPNIDLNLKTKVELANILRIVKEVALIFDIKDLQTLSANGQVDADFNIKSNLKTIKSNGHLNVPNADLYYGLYKIGIDNINANVKLDNNNIDIKNIGFTILNQPLRVYGSVSSDAISDLHLNANNLSLKGLLVALGQASLMKENEVKSGLISLNGDIVGKLDKINPAIKLNLNNINIKNKPSNTSIVLPNTTIGIKSDGISFSGNVTSNNAQIINPCAKITAPSLNATIDEKEIKIAPAKVSIDNINTTVSGTIKNYMTEKINLDFTTTGDIKSKLTGDMNVAKQSLNLNYFTTELSSIIIPMFEKSRMSFNGNIVISGNMMNPNIKGSVTIPSINIPEIPVTMDNLLIKLDGPILNGSAKVDKFTSGGIVAENLTSIVRLKGNDFYLTDLKGNAFDGKINGNIIYNLANAKTNVVFKGEGMNATKAVEGAAGIKNAISGTLGFDTNLTLVVADYNEMMKSLKGNLKFNVQKGAFGTIGRFDRLLQANNLMTNSVLKTTVSTITDTVTMKDTAKFEYIDGNLDFNNGWANINPIKSAGKTLAYYITGRYNLVNGTTNINILGRLDSFIISKLGLLGELSADKIISYIPVLGPATSKIVQGITVNPKNENISAIPALTTGSTNYKDFKVVFNGGLESTSSIKSFKWLTTVDMSAIEQKSVKDTLNDIKTSIGTDYQNTVNSVKDMVTTSKENWKTQKEAWKQGEQQRKENWESTKSTAKEDWKNTKDQFKNDMNELKNLFKY